MAKFTFARDYMERQPGSKRHYKDWKAGETYVMTKEHATALQEQGYGHIGQTSETLGGPEMVGRSVSDSDALDD